MNTLFDPIHAGELHLANRIVMAPLTRNRAPGAIATPLMATYYAQRASAGLIITEATAISHQGQGYSDVPGIWSDAQVAAWRPVTEGVHAAGGKIVVQLWHVGRVSHVDLQPGGAAPVAPSAIAAKTKTVLIKDGVPRFVETSEPRALRAEELPGIVADYRHAARCAAAAGFDGVEVHASNGYLIDQFVRSSSNHRTDAYGGAIENRARLLLQIIAAVRAKVGAQFGVWLRLDAEELHTPGGISLDDAKAVARMAEAAGVDAVSVSASARITSGVVFTEAPLVHKPGGFMEWTASVRWVRLIAPPAFRRQAGVNSRSARRQGRASAWRRCPHAA